MALTIIHKITNAINKLGVSNGTKITEPEYDGEEKSNSAREQWFVEWRAMAEYMVASTASKVAEARAEKAKLLIKSVFGPMLAKLTVGDSNAIVRGNITTVFNLRNGQRRINAQAVINVLSSDDYKWKLDDINKFLEKINLAGNPALYITPSTTME